MTGTAGSGKSYHGVRLVRVFVGTAYLVAVGVAFVAGVVVLVDWLWAVVP